MSFDKYTGRKFYFGKCDCGTLTIEYLNDTYNLCIKDHNRKEYLDNNNFVYNSWIKEGMLEVNENKINTGDVLIFYFKQYPIHCAVCVEEDKFLSIEPRELSKIYTKEELFNKYKLAYHLRHKDLV